MAMSMSTLKKHHNVPDPITTLGIDSVLCLFMINGLLKEWVDLLSSKRLSEPRPARRSRRMVALYGMQELIQENNPQKMRFMNEGCYSENKYAQGLVLVLLR